MDSKKKKKNLRHRSIQSATPSLFGRAFSSGRAARVIVIQTEGAVGFFKLQVTVLGNKKRKHISPHKI